jgi:hypothetical protein
MKLFSPIGGIKLGGLNAFIHLSMCIASLVLTKDISSAIKSPSYIVQEELGYVGIVIAFFIGHLIVGAL